MARAATPALALLARAGVAVTIHPYTAPGVAAYGTEAAEALELDPHRVFKTLVAEVDGRPVLAMVPVSGSLDLKALAAARGGKKATMADPAAAERLTGYVTGGISPLGTRQRLPLVLDDSAARFPDDLLLGREARAADGAGAGRPRRDGRGVTAAVAGA